MTQHPERTKLDSLISEQDYSLSTNGRPKSQSVTEFIDYCQKHRPQTNALSVGALSVLNGGMQFAWGIFNHHLIGKHEGDKELCFVVGSWFLSAVVGFFISALFVKKFSKLSIYFVSLILSCVSWIILIIDSKSFEMWLTSRLFGGFSYGIVYVTILIHAAEVSHAGYRGINVSSIHLIFMLGILVGNIDTLSINVDTSKLIMDPHQVPRYLGIFNVIIALTFGLFFHRESPVFYLKRSKVDRAMEILTRLRSESDVTDKIRREVDDHQQMILQDSIASGNICHPRNLKGLILLKIMRLSSVAIFNLILNIFLLREVSNALNDEKKDPANVALCIVKFIIMVITTHLSVITRKLVFKISSLGSFICFTVIFIAIMIEGDGSFVTLVFVFVLQITTASLNSIFDIYATEAFSINTKPLSIAFTSSIEFLTHFGIVILYFYADAGLSITAKKMTFVAACSMLVISIISFLIPDTTNLSLKNARAKLAE